MNSAIIVAGGHGTRLNQITPKQFLIVEKQEILDYSVTTFFNHHKINEVIIVCPPEWVNHVRHNHQYCHIVVGGDTRQKSSQNGIAACNPDAQNILIHDAARPLVSPTIISNCLTALEKYACAVPVININDSTIFVEQSSIYYLDRSHLKRVQTPQGFKAELIREVIKRSNIGTDEFSQVLKFKPNSSYALIPGEIDNFKITTEKDLSLFKYIISYR